MLNVKVLRCLSCGHVYAPPAYFCRSCRSEKLEETEIPGKGVLYTYSTVHVPLASLEKEAPYTVAIVELEKGCKVTGRLANSSPEQLAIGALVELIELRDGTYIFGFEDRQD
jgi:uncharacterized OB-fold protein